jgi:undecaprenyl-phosphate 4-deoxy-4-formamido-L-arabinose transferase
MLRLGISVVVPVERSLVGVVECIERVLDQTGSEYEVELVNDGSRDGSWRKIQKLANQNPTVVTLDDDGQNPPEEIPKLLARLDEGYDLVYGAPREKLLEHASLVERVLRRALPVSRNLFKYLSSVATK